MLKKLSERLGSQGMNKKCEPLPDICRFLVACQGRTHTECGTRVIKLYKVKGNIFTAWPNSNNSNGNPFIWGPGTRPGRG